MQLRFQLGSSIVCALYNITYIKHMAIGGSGRIVLEIDPELKRRLYSMLALENKTLKEWFVALAVQHIDTQQQPSLFDSATDKKRP